MIRFITYAALLAASVMAAAPLPDGWQQRQPLYWTDSLPTEEGWYWHGGWKAVGGDEIVYIRLESGKAMVVDPNLPFALEAKGRARWAGPISRPLER